MKKESDIDVAALEYNIPRAINGSEKTLNYLMRCTWALLLLNDLADWCSRVKHMEVDERGKPILDIIEARIRQEIGSITNPRKSSWRRVLKSWSYKVARTCCESVRQRKQRRERRYRVVVEHEHTDRIEHGTRILAPRAPVASEREQVEREREEERQQALRKRLSSEIHRTVRRLLSASTPEDERILSLWAKGNTLDAITAELKMSGVKMSRSSVERRLKELQKAIIEGIRKAGVKVTGETKSKGIGRGPKLKKLAQHRGGFQELIANSLRGHELTQSCSAPNRVSHTQARK